MTRQIPNDIADHSLVPIIVGVTGHRYISSRNNLAVSAVFDELDRKYPDTPIVVLSSVAEGADRLVAQVALQTIRRRGTSISLICTLPMPREEYAIDFKELLSKEEFDDLLDSKCSSWFELPLVAGVTLENIRDEQGDPRKKQYEQVGVFVAQHSHILLALWDGVDNPEKQGGTSQIVKMRHEGKLKSDINPLDEVDTGPIYHFPTEEIENDGKIGERREIFPEMELYSRNKEQDAISENKAKEFNRVLFRLNSFNFDVKRAHRKLAAKIEENREFVVPKASTNLIEGFPRRILQHYAVADTLAGYYRFWSDKTTLTLFILALLALVCFELYAHLITWPGILAGYPILLLVGILIYYVARMRYIQSRYLDYRALAEGLRVQFFWCLFGLSEEVVDFYLRKQKSELDWIKHAIRAVNTPFAAAEFAEKSEANNTPGQPSNRGFESFVLERWVRDQAGFYTRKALEHHELSERQEKRIRFFFLTGLALSIAVVFADPFLHDNEAFAVLDNIKLHHILIVIMGIAPAIAAAIGGYAEKMAITAQAKRYNWMSGIFSRGEKELSRLLEKGDIDKARQVIFDLGQEALEENGDWLIIRRERKLEMPTG